MQRAKSREDDFHLALSWILLESYHSNSIIANNIDIYRFVNRALPQTRFEFIARARDKQSFQKKISETECMPTGVIN
jgi:hypothetical protein